MKQTCITCVVFYADSTVGVCNIHTDPYKQWLREDERSIEERMMPWPYEASVINLAGIDYWRTWFIEECEFAGLFGINEKHLPLIKASGPGFSAYRVGTEIFLEDAPYFKASKAHHRVCGPYHVVAAKVTAESKPVYVVDEAVIIYQEATPKKVHGLIGLGSHALSKV